MNGTFRGTIYLMKRQSNDMNKLPRVEVDLIIEGKTFDVEEFTDKLNILPTMTRTKEDWPSAIKNNLSIPEELSPRCMWGINESADLCEEIGIPISGIVSKLEGKEENLIKLCKDQLQYLTVQFS